MTTILQQSGTSGGLAASNHAKGATSGGSHLGGALGGIGNVSMQSSPGGLKPSSSANTRSHIQLTSLLTPQALSSNKS